MNRWAEKWTPWVLFFLFFALPQLFREYAAGLMGGFTLLGMLVLYQTRPLKNREKPGEDDPSSPFSISVSKAVWNGVLRGFVLIFVSALIISGVPLGAWLSRPLLLPHSLEKADAIVMMACGFMPSGSPDFGGLQRFLHSVELYRKGRSELLLFSTSAIEKDGYRQLAWVASLTQLMKLPEKAVEVMTQGVDTRSEAKAIAERLLPRGIKRILLVTNGPHILRTVKVFEKCGFEVLPAPVQDEKTIGDADSRWGLFQYALHEWLGLALYWARGDIDFPFGVKKTE